MADVTIGADILGNSSGLKRALDDGVQAVKSSANKINNTKATFKLDLNPKDFWRDFERNNKEFDKRIRDQERKVASAAKTRGRHETNVGRQLAIGNNPASALTALGGKGIAAVAAIQVAESTVKGANAYAAGKAARARGDIEGEVAAESDLNQMAKSIPLVGELGAAIRERITGEQEYIKSLEFATKMQDKQVEQGRARLKRVQELDEGAKRSVRGMSRADEDRFATAPQREASSARRLLSDTIEEQDKERGERNLTSGQLALRDSLGSEVARTVAVSRAASRTTRSREATGRIVEQQDRDAEGLGLAKDRQRARAGSRTARTVAAAGRRADEENQVEARRQGEAGTRETELRAGGQDRSADFLAITEELRKSIKAAGEDPELKDQARRRFDVQSGQLNDEARERRVARGASTRSAELQAQGKAGAARVADIEEDLRQALRNAGDDPELQSQARRRAAAELKAEERELSFRVATQRAESVNVQTTDLTGRFSGPTDPNAETPKILKDIIAASLAKIEQNTRGGAGMAP